MSRHVIGGKLRLAQMRFRTRLRAFLGRLAWPLRKLGLARAVDLAMLVLTLTSVFIAIQSYRVAVKTLKDARASGLVQQAALKDQIAALTDARRALEAMVMTTATQQALLEQTAKSTGAQVALLTKQQERELEQADVHAVLFYPQKPAILVENRGARRVASDVLYNVAFWNMSASTDLSFGLLGARATKIEYILPNRAIGPTSLELHPSVVERQPKEGDKLFGYATVQCPVCSKTRTYWIFIVYGKEGVFAEGGEREYRFHPLSKDEGPIVVERFLRRHDLKRIPTRLE